MFIQFDRLTMTTQRLHIRVKTVDKQKQKQSKVLLKEIMAIKKLSFDQTGYMRMLHLVWLTALISVTGVVVSLGWNGTASADN